MWRALAASWLLVSCARPTADAASEAGAPSAAAVLSVAPTPLPGPAAAPFATELAAIGANPSSRKDLGDADHSPDGEGRRMSTYGYAIDGLVHCNLDVMDDHPSAWKFWVIAPSTKLTQFAPASGIRPIVKTDMGQWYELTAGPLSGDLLYTVGNDNFHVASYEWSKMKNVDMAGWIQSHPR